MNTEKINTLAKIHAAQDIIITAIADPELSAADVKALQGASAKLRSIERAIVAQVGEALVNSLTADSEKLKALTEEMKASTEKLSAVADGLEKASKVVEAFISIVSKAASAGLL